MYRGRVDLSLVILSHNRMGFMSSSVRSCPDIFLYFFPSQLLYSFPSQRYRVILSSCYHYPCENTVLNHFAIKGFCTSWNDNWIQLSFLEVQNTFIAKWLNTVLKKQSMWWPWGPNDPDLGCVTSVRLPNMWSVVGNPVPIVRESQGNYGKWEVQPHTLWTVRTRTHGQNWHLWEDNS